MLAGISDQSEDGRSDQPEDGGDGMAVLPFSWAGVRVQASGADGSRVRVTPMGPDSVRLRLADACGAPLAEVEALTFRSVSMADLSAAAPGADELFQLDWTPAPVPAPAAAGSWAEWPDSDLTGLADLTATGPVGDRGRRARPASPTAAVGSGPKPSGCCSASRPGSPGHALSARLVVVTRGAVAAGGPVAGPGRSGGVGPGPVGADEHPDRVCILVDARRPPPTSPPLPLAIDRAAGRRLRRSATGARCSADRPPATPRRPARQRASVPDADRPRSARTAPCWSPAAPGRLGRLVARHLVSRARRPAPAAGQPTRPRPTGAAELVAELAELGAVTALAACDVADRAALGRPAADVDPSRPRSSTRPGCSTTAC